MFSVRCGVSGGANVVPTLSQAPAKTSPEARRKMRANARRPMLDIGFLFSKSVVPASGRDSLLDASPPDDAGLRSNAAWSGARRSSAGWGRRAPDVLAAGR